MTKDHGTLITTPPDSRAGSIRYEDRLWRPGESRRWSDLRRRENLAPKVGEARKIRTRCSLPILALTIAGLLALPRPAAAVYWHANCYPLRVVYDFNTNQAAMQLLSESGMGFAVAFGRITRLGPDNADAMFPGNIVMRVIMSPGQMNPGQLFVVGPTGTVDRICLPNTNIGW